MYLHSLIGGASAALRRAAEVEDYNARIKRSERELKEGICKPVIELGEKLSALPPDRYNRQFRMRVTENMGDIFIELTYHQPPLTFSKEDSTGRGSAYFRYTLQDEHRDREHDRFPRLSLHFKRLYDRAHFENYDISIQIGNRNPLYRKPHWFFAPQIDTAFCIETLAEWCGQMAPDRVAEITRVFAEVPVLSQGGQLQALKP